MDELQLIAIVAVSSAVGFIAAHVRNARQMREIHRTYATAHIKSCILLIHAALTTLIKDFNIPEKDAQDKLFVRAEAAGMKLVQIDTKTGGKVDLGEKL